MTQQPKSALADGEIAAEAEVVIARPAAEIFNFWRALENFPRFMGHVKEVRPLGDNRHLWRVSGPLGTEMSWNSRVTQLVDNGAMCWESEEGSSLENRGAVHFVANGPSSTTVKVRLTYAPPLGVIGHAVATLLGKNPSQQMADDLGRCKELLESGATATPERVVGAAEARQPVDPAGTVS